MYPISDYSYIMMSNTFVSNELKTLFWQHLFDHLAADGTSLTGGQIAIVTLLERNADFVGSFHLKTVHSFFCFRDNNTVAGRIRVRHNFIHSLNFENKVCAFAVIVSARNL